MDDRETDETDDVAVPLPRRGARAHQIGDAHRKLYGDDPDKGMHGWGDVQDRERSAAFARSATARRPAISTGTSTDVDGPEADGSQAVPTDRTEQRGPGDDVGAADRPAAEQHPGPDAPARRRRSARRAALLAAGVLLAFVAGTAVGLLAAPAPPAAQTPAVAPSRPVIAGDVVRVADAARVTVLVDDRPVEVAVIGLDPPRLEGPARCGADTSTRFATDTLVGQRVTLVPDALGAEFDQAGRRWAYVVLATQQNYTDLALLQGIGRWDTSRGGTYGQVFAREQAQARDAGVGIWGAPCRAAP